MPVTGSGVMAGSARLVLVDGAVLLHPEPSVFEAILAGWRLQQESRLLAAPTVDSRDKTLRRFQAFTGEYPWRVVHAVGGGWANYAAGQAATADTVHT
jgi:integrase/recombinase XerC